MQSGVDRRVPKNSPYLHFVLSSGLILFVFWQSWVSLYCRTHHQSQYMQPCFDNKGDSAFILQTKLAGGIDCGDRRRDKKRWNSGFGRSPIKFYRTAVISRLATLNLVEIGVIKACSNISIPSLIKPPKKFQEQIKEYMVLPIKITFFPISFMNYFALIADFTEYDSAQVRCSALQRPTMESCQAVYPAPLHRIYMWTSLKF